jgi:tetratricopeptide (TPR) repeat protein
LKAKAYYGLARIAALRNDPDLAVSLFKKTLESSPEDREKAWALTYLGRLSDIAGEPEEAANYYKAALAVEGASDAARSMARKGASGAFRRVREP